MPKQHTALDRAHAFCEDYALNLPILMAPMAGASPPALAAAVASAGGMGGCGVLLMQPDKIADWTAEFRSASNGAFQLNTWIPDPDPVRDANHEAAVRSFLERWGPDVPADAGDAGMPDFDAQCEAMLAAGPPVISSIMGVYPDAFVSQMKERNIRWFAHATTVAEALAAEAAGADAIIAQGMEAGGHRGAFVAAEADANMVGLFSLLPAVVDAVNVPVIATGGIADGRGVAAALILGASAVQVGTGLLRTPEAGLPTAWADALAETKPENTMATRAFSGRLGRSVRTPYAVAAAASDAPAPAPYPIQRNLTKAMRDEATRNNSLDGMQAWAGQSAAFARTEAAGSVVQELWDDARAILAGSP